MTEKLARVYDAQEPAIVEPVPVEVVAAPSPFALGFFGRFLPQMLKVAAAASAAAYGDRGRFHPALVAAYRAARAEGVAATIYEIVPHVGPAKRFDPDRVRKVARGVGGMIATLVPHELQIAER